MTVGLVIVSHSGKIAEGVVDLARQMAADVPLEAAGGHDGGIGTDFERVHAALQAAESGDGVVVLCDLGSAILTTETALEFLDEADSARVRIADAPIVEGAVAAAVAAQGGADLEGVLAAAQTAAGHDADPTPRGAGDMTADPAPVEPGAATDTIALVNRQGLHARPAADFVKLASSFDAAVTINGVDAKSLLRIMSLGLVAGDQVTLEATGPQAQDAVRALGDLVRSGFGED